MGLLFFARNTSSIIGINYIGGICYEDGYKITEKM